MLSVVSEEDLGKLLQEMDQILYVTWDQVRRKQN